MLEEQAPASGSVGTHRTPRRADHEPSAQDARAAAQRAADAQLLDVLEILAERWRSEHGAFGRFRVGDIRVSVEIDLHDDRSEPARLPLEQMPSLVELADELGWPALAGTTSAGAAVRALLEHARRDGHCLQVKDVAAWLRRAGLSVSNASQLLGRLTRRQQAIRLSHGRFVGRPGSLDELLPASIDPDPN